MLKLPSRNVTKGQKLFMACHSPRKTDLFSRQGMVSECYFCLPTRFAKELPCWQKVMSFRIIIMYDDIDLCSFIAKGFVWYGQ